MKLRQYLIEALDAFGDPLFIVSEGGSVEFATGSFELLLFDSKSSANTFEIELSAIWPDYASMKGRRGHFNAELYCSDGRKLFTHLSCEELDGGGFLYRVCSHHFDSDMAVNSYQNQRLETLGILAGGIAHDFNNILAGILGHITYLKTVLPAAGSHTESLQAIEDGARKASGMTQQILDFSKLEVEEKPTAINLCQLSQSTCRLLRGALTPEYKLDIVADEEDGINILAVEAKVAQIIVNLIINARDASEPDSVIRISISKSTSVELLQEVFGCEELSVDEYAVISVEDTGVGIPDEIVERVFEPYFTTKKDSGTGLGLATVRALVHQFGGEIALRSEVGEGTEVSVFLPVIQKHQSQSIDTGIKREALLKRGTEKILVVDDESPVRNVLMMSLEHLGYHVETAGSGMEAISKFKGAESGFDLVILDMLMPKLPGEEVYEILREIDPDVRVLVISGFSSEKAVQKILSNGGLGFIQKPFTITDLSEKVRSCFPDQSQLHIS